MGREVEQNWNAMVLQKAHGNRIKREVYPGANKSLNLYFLFYDTHCSRTF